MVHKSFQETKTITVKDENKNMLRDFKNFVTQISIAAFQIHCFSNYENESN